jgi:hypothetical protein
MLMCELCVFLLGRMVLGSACWQYQRLGIGGLSLRVTECRHWSKHGVDSVRQAVFVLLWFRWASLSACTTLVQS